MKVMPSNSDKKAEGAAVSSQCSATIIDGYSGHSFWRHRYNTRRKITAGVIHS
jgi:hypothetical protein